MLYSKLLISNNLIKHTLPKTQYKKLLKGALLISAESGKSLLSTSITLFDYHINSHCLPKFLKSYMSSLNSCRKMLFIFLCITAVQFTSDSIWVIMIRFV